MKTFCIASITLPDGRTVYEIAVHEFSQVVLVTRCTSEETARMAANNLMRFGYREVEVPEVSNEPT